MIRKNVLALVLVFTFSVTLSSCGSGETSDRTTAPETSNQSSANTPKEDLTDSGSVKVDENLLTVDITLPASMFEGTDMSTFDADAYAEEQGFNKAVINDDGSVTVTMTKAKHKELMAETMAEIDNSFLSMIEAEDTPYIKEIKHADDFSTIDIMVDRAGYEADGIMSAFLPMMVYLQGSVYQIFNGSEQRSEISFVDIDTGEILASVVYPDALLEE